MQDTLGNLKMIKVPVNLVSRIKARLQSITSVLQAYPETITIEAHQLTLSGTTDEARGQLIARVNPVNNLPISNAHRSSADTPRAAAALNITLNTVHESNLNLE